MLQKLKNVLQERSLEGEETRRKSSLWQTAHETEELAEVLSRLHTQVQSLDEVARRVLEEGSRRSLDSQALFDPKFLVQLGENMAYIKSTLQEVVREMAEIQNKCGPVSDSKYKTLLMKMEKLEEERKGLKISEDNNREMLNTLNTKYQATLKQLKETQDRLKKDNPSTLREIIEDYDKKFQILNSKISEKDHQIGQRKQKQQQLNTTLNSISSDLVQKELYVKRIKEKYEQSKGEVKQFRAEKNALIQRQNEKIEELYITCSELREENCQLKEKASRLQAQLEEQENRLNAADIAGIEVSTLRTDVVNLQAEISLLRRKSEMDQEQSIRVSQELARLLDKKQQLLKNLENPINHERAALRMIAGMIDKLYKDYMETVFLAKNIIGFEQKITQINSVVQDMIEDLDL